MYYGLKKKKSESRTQPTVIEAGYSENEKCFNIMFVRYDDQRSMEVVESSVIDFNKVIEHLAEGNSVFIAPKRKQNKHSVKKHSKNSLGNYINHV
jgi:hypothetical protein